MTAPGSLLHNCCKLEQMETNRTTEEKVTIEYRGLVSAISHRMIQNPEMAKDAAQEAWLEILKSLKTFKGKSKL